MRQQINLYRTNTGNGEKYNLTALRIFQIAGNLLLVLILSSGFRWYQKIKNEDELSRIETKQTETEKRLHEKEAELASKENKTIKESIAKETNKLNEEYQVNKLVLTTLSSVQSKKNQGFSVYFRAFARQGFADIWLTEFDIKGGGSKISLQGSTLEAKNIPKLIKKFSNEDILKGKTFEVFKLFKDEKSPQIIFLLETEKSDTK